MKSVCVVRTLDDERELVIIGGPDPEPTLAVLSVPVDDPSADADVRVIASDLRDLAEARMAAVEHTRSVADDELARTGRGTTIDLRYGDDEWRAAMGLARQDGSRTSGSAAFSPETRHEVGSTRAIAAIGRPARRQTDRTEVNRALEPVRAGIVPLTA